MKQIFTFLLALCSMWVTAQNQINPITITLPVNPPANTAEWATALPPVMIMAQAKMQNGQINPMIVESKILVTIKNGAGKICGMYNQQNAPMSNFNTASKNWTGANVLSLLGQECTLPPGSYELCVKFISPNMASGTAVLGEACKPFTIVDTKQQVYNAPQNISPANEKVFNTNDQNAPITFRWTPVLPRPKDQVTYRLKVWQLMQGQSGTQAMRSNPPIVTKDVDNITQAIVANIITGPCRPPYLCEFVWNVQSLNKEGNPIGNNNGMSELSSWSFGATQTSTITNIAPVDKMEIAPKDANTINFRWTPVLPKPKDPVTYRLKVWQLMQGQSGSQAMRSNPPIVTKDVDNITETTLSNIYTGPCRPPYLCEFVWNVQALDKDSKPIGNNDGMSELSSWSFGATQTSTITNIAPVDKMEIAPKDANAITFRWTPVLPKPKDPVTYRLKVWQLMQGQSGSQAMRSKLPIVVKDVDNITETTLSNIYTGPCRPPYLCEYVWQVEASKKSATGDVEMLGNTAPSTFRIGSAAATAACCPGTWGTIQTGTTPSLGTTLIPWSLLPSVPSGSTFYMNTCYNCGSSCGTPSITYQLFDGITNLPVGPLVTDPTGCTTVAYNLPASLSTSTGYVFKITAYCGGVICDSSKLQFSPLPPSLPSCCTGSSWGAMQWCNSGLTPCPLTAMPPCNGTLGSLNCSSVVNFNVAYNCAPGCGPAQIMYNIYNSSGTLYSSTTAASGATTGVTMPPAPAGTYTMTIYTICGGVTCDSCKYQFSTINCCTGGSWGTKKWGFTAATPNPLPTFGLIAAGCNPNIFFNVTYTCGSSCTSTIEYKFFDASNVVISSYSYAPGVTPAIPIPALASYFKVYAKCGSQYCDSITNKITVTPACVGSSWGPKAYKPAPFPIVPWTALPCSVGLMPMHHSSITKFRACYNCTCGPTTIRYTVTGPGTYSWVSPLVPSCAVVNVPMSPTLGTGVIKIEAFCNGVLCNTCIDKLKIIW